MQYFVCQHCRKWTEANYARARLEVCSVECFTAHYSGATVNSQIIRHLGAGGDDGFDVNEESTHRSGRLPSQATRTQPIPSPSKRGRPRLSNETILAIFDSPLPAGDAARHFEVSEATVYGVRNGKYAAVTGDAKPACSRSKRSNLPPERVLEIYASVGPYRPIAERFDVSENIVESIKNGRTYRDITGHVRQSPKR